MKKRNLSILLVSLICLTAFTSGTVVNEPCQISIRAERPDWWTLPNSSGTFDLIVYSPQAAVFDLNEQQVDALKHAHQIGLAMNKSGTFRLCSFR